MRRWIGPPRRGRRSSNPHAARTRRCSPRRAGCSARWSRRIGSSSARCATTRPTWWKAVWRKVSTARIRSRWRPSDPGGSSGRSAAAAWAPCTWPSASDGQFEQAGRHQAGAAPASTRHALGAPLPRRAPDPRLRSSIPHIARTARRRRARADGSALPRDGVRRGRADRRATATRRRLGVARAAAAVPRRVRGGAVRPPAPRRPPRPQARQHPGDRRRAGEAARLRHRASCSRTSAARPTLR